MLHQLAVLPQRIVACGGVRCMSLSAARAGALADVPASWRRPHVAGLSMLTSEQVDAYFEDGYVLVRDVFDPEELKPVMAAIDGMVDELAGELLAAGKVTDTHADAGFHDRLTALEGEFPHVSVLLHKRGVLPQAVADLWGSPRLLNMAEQLVGPDIAAHPVWNLRCKTPHQEQATVPWHQDAAYLARDSWTTLQATAWVPLVDANAVNGCMQVVRGGHRPGKVAPHSCCAGGTWYVELAEGDMERELGVDLAADVVTCEVPLGSVLLLNNLVPHQSLPNLSNSIRWSLDLRWQRPDRPNGFYGLKDSLVLAKADDPDYVPDWASWGAVDRTQLQAAATPSPRPSDDDTFDTTISGPWMAQWPMVHHNRHTATFKDGEVHGWHKA